MTTISETFDTANSTILGPLLTWTEVTGEWAVVSNNAQNSLDNSRARAESDLATTNHYAEVVAAKAANVANRPGVCVRYATAADTCYAVWTRGSTSTTYLVQKIVAGVVTTLGSFNTASGLFVNSGDTLRLEVDGSTIKVMRNGAQIGTDITDTSITTGTRSGIYCALGTYDFASFMAGDLGVAVVRNLRVGAATANALRLGSTTVTKAYLGTTLVHEA